MVTIGLATFLLMPLLPGGGDVTARVQTFGDLKEDNSAQARSEFATGFVPKLLENPAGLGLGTVGLATKIQNDGRLGEYANFDNGYWAIFITFGVPCGLLFFRTLWTISRMLYQTRRAGPLATHSCLAHATLAATVFGLVAANIVTGIGGMMLWLLVGCCLGASKVPDGAGAPSMAPVSAVPEPPVASGHGRPQQQEYGVKRRKAGGGVFRHRGASDV